MVSKDTVDRMVDGADDFSKVWKVSSRQVTELASINSRGAGAAKEIAPEADFKAAQYASELGVRTFTQYRTAYQIFEGVILTASREARAIA